MCSRAVSLMCHLCHSAAGSKTSQLQLQQGVSQDWQIRNKHAPWDVRKEQDKKQLDISGVKQHQPACEPVAGAGQMSQHESACGSRLSVAPAPPARPHIFLQ